MTKKVTAKAVGRIFSLDSATEIGIAYLWDSGEAELAFHDSKLADRLLEEGKIAAPSTLAAKNPSESED